VTELAHDGSVMVAVPPETVTTWEMTGDEACETVMVESDESTIA
jgi:hypothetical protein